MFRLFTLAIITALICGCSGLAEPELSINTFTDSYYPCVKVVFPEAIALNDYGLCEGDNEETASYIVSLPAQRQHSFKIVKRRFMTQPPKDNTSALEDVKFPDWTHPLSEQFDESVKIYEIDTEDAAGREAVVVFTQTDNGDIYLRGIVGEGTALRPPDVGQTGGKFAAGVFIMVDRLIQRAEFAYLFSLEHWRETQAGKRFIEDMKKQTDWLYNNTYIVECK
jgi:hypothetical protein